MRGGWDKFDNEQADDYTFHMVMEMLSLRDCFFFRS
jgi:hypothetical protein